MTAAKTAPASSTYVTGLCASGFHDRCRGTYAGVTCGCEHHTAPPEEEPEPVAPAVALPYPCYCLPGPARCDDHDACDRSRCRQCTATPAACLTARVKCCPDCTHTAEQLCPLAMGAIRRVQDVLEAAERWHDRYSMPLFDGSKFAPTVEVAAVRNALDGS